MPQLEKIFITPTGARVKVLYTLPTPSIQRRHRSITQNIAYYKKTILQLRARLEEGVPFPHHLHFRIANLQGSQGQAERDLSDLLGSLLQVEFLPPGPFIFCC
jgi:hypothetical protein